MARKDEWNASHPIDEKQFLQFVQHPELARLLPVLYPKQFPHLEALKAPREDLVAIFLTGLPAGIVPGFQNKTGKVLAEMLRLNVAVPPAKEPNVLGLVGGDLAGYPNGRRVTDDVTNISLRAVAGARIRSSKSTTNRTRPSRRSRQGITPLPFRSQSTFPYVATPHDGFDFPSTTK